jgi:excisionase family DNA binding protein
MKNQSITENGELLRVPEAARMWGVKPATVRSWLLKRQIPFVRLTPRAIRIRRSDVESVINRAYVPAK